MPFSKEKFQLTPDYYRPVNPVVTALVIVFPWILFPMMVFFPTLLAPFVHQSVIQTLIAYHSNLLKLFQIHIWIHAIESIVALQRCRRLGINANTTLSWTGSVAIHGIFALKFLIWPDKEARKIHVH